MEFEGQDGLHVFMLTPDFISLEHFYFRHPVYVAGLLHFESLCLLLLAPLVPSCNFEVWRSRANPFYKPEGHKLQSMSQKM